MMSFKKIFLLLGIGVGLLGSLLMLTKPKKTQAPESYHFIDNFNRGQEPNMVGGKRFFELSSGAVLNVSYEKMPQPEDSKMPEFCLKVEQHVSEGQFARLGMEFNGLDISAAEDFTFRIKGDVQDIRLIVKDRDGHRATVNLASYGTISSQWQTVKIPVGAFSGIDFGKLEVMLWEFAVSSSAAPKTVYLDDLAFYREEGYVFKTSLMDNISGFPQKLLVSNARKQELLNINDPKKFIREVAKDTWVFFRDIVDSHNHLVLDFVAISPEKQIGDFTSVTNIGLYFMCVLSAYDMGFLPREAAVERIKNTLDVLGRLPRWKGLWYNFYSTTNMQVTRRYISSVDNGWLAVGFVVVRNAFPELKPLCTSYLEGMDFKALYDESLGQISLGYDVENEEMSPYHYGLLCTEPRVTSLLAMGKGDLPHNHWFRLYRTLPKEWDWQEGQPQGVFKTQEGVRYWQSFYDVNGTRIVPSWGGSLFEFLMPSLVMKEQELAPKGLGLNNMRAIQRQREFALKEKKYPVWGMSPCSTPDGRGGGYDEFGVPGLGSKTYKDSDVVTPHVTFLALDYVPQEAVSNLKEMLKRYDIYGEYGFYDSVDMNTNKVSYRYMSLDQGMSLIAMDNFVNNGIMRERFHKDPYIQSVEYLLSEEDFFNL